MENETVGIGEPARQTAAPLHPEPTGRLTESLHGHLDSAWFHTLLKSRRSIRRYSPQPVPRPLLTQLLDAANWAPSAHNRQPWRFCVVVEDAVKERLSLAMGRRWRRDLTADGADPAFIARRVDISHARITGAGALIIACMSMEEMDDYADPQRRHAEWTMATQSVALACQNLLLSAHSLGLGACWMCAPLFVPELVRSELDLPGQWEPQALITVGYPAETRVRERAPIESRVIWR